MQVKLAREWTDATGTTHPAGAMVDLDAVTLAELEATGVVTPAKPSWGGPTDKPSWGGPTGAGG